MKTVEVLTLLKGVASHPTDRLGYYRKYVLATCELLELSDSLREMMLDKANKVFSRYHELRVRYSPEMEIVVPYYFATKRPMVTWKGLNEEKYMKLRTICAMAGQVICAGFRLNRRIIMIDIDVKNESISDKVLEILDDVSRIGLPCKLTWSGGLHIYIPVNTARGLVVDHNGKLLLNTAPSIGNDDVIVEVKIDAVTVHPLQSWLWIEAEYGSEPPSTVTLKRCAIPNKAPSINWFLYGKSLRYDVNNGLEIYGQVIDIVTSKLRLEKPSFTLREPSLDEVMSPLLEVKENFQVGEGAKRGRTGALMGMITVLRRDISFEAFLQFLREIYNRYIHFKCVHYFIFAEGEEPDNPHYCNIVGWYITQHLKLWTLDEVRDKLAPYAVSNWNERRKRAKARKIMLYYWTYYATPIELDGEIIFLRPRWVPQLREAWSHLHGSGYCRDCPHEKTCGSVETASRGLINAINSLIFDIVYHFTDLVHYLDPRIVRRALIGGRILPLPLPG